MNPLFISGAPRSFFRDTLIAPREQYVQVHGGKVDVPLLASQYPPSLVACLWGCDSGYEPVGLADLHCPKVLILGDTHHMERPLNAAMRMATEHPWDMVVMQFNRQHCHFFAEAGVNVAWIPCFMISPHDLPPTERTMGVTMAAGMQCHPYRQFVMTELRRKGIPIGWHTGTREQMAAIHNQSIVSLNVSLNGDFNLRNFEVMAAGGFLVTDRLSEYSGQSEILKDGENCRLFSTAKDCESIIRHYMLHPDEAKAIARRGYDDYWAHHSPVQKRVDFYTALAGKRTWDDDRMRFPKGDIFKRIRMYEEQQEAYRVGESWRYMCDASDLVRIMA